jgi:uncharacterized protein YabN with tetrapyrrole methylase and pyrophosphatase domain
MAQLAVQAAKNHGRAAIAVAGHPVIANPAAAMLAQMAQAAGIHFSMVGASSFSDTYAEYTGRDLVTSGAVLLDARCLVRQSYVIDPRLSLLIWNVAYLAPEERLRLAAYLIGRSGQEWPIQVCRTGCMTGSDRVAVYSLGMAGTWTAMVDYETTIVIPGRY